MTKPDLLTASYLSAMDIQQFDRYTPSAFNDSLNMLQKVNKIIKQLNDVGVITNNMLDKWNEVIAWITAEGLTDTVNTKLTEWYNDGTLDTIIGNVLDNIGAKVTGVYAYSEYGIAVANADNSTQLQNAINDIASKGGGVLQLPYGTIQFGTALTMKDKVTLQGVEGDSNATNLQYNGAGFAIKTGGSHLRQNFRKFNLTLNSISSGILIGDAIANLNRDAGILPRQIRLENVVIQGLTVNNIGIKLFNASHITMNSVRSAYGTGGTGLQITCDGYNSGVFVANECTFGRVNEMNVGLEMINNSGGLDGYTFNSCYFGGKLPVWLHGVNDTSRPKALTFNSPHVEITAQPTATEVYGFDVNKVTGLVINTALIAGFGATNVTAYLFRTQSHGINIIGTELNEFGAGNVFKNLSTSPRNSIFGEATITTSGDSTLVTQFNGDFGSSTTIGGRMRHDFVETRNLFFANSNKITMGTLTDRPTSATRGDKHFNTDASELGTTGSKYTLNGWNCTAGSSTSPTWVEMRALTGN